jgi:folylpolyglutamate synthase/dihydropteroate synthase
MSTLQELKQEADELGVSYAKNVSANKLQEKIEQFYEAKETSGAEVEALVAKKEASTPEPVVAKADSLDAKRLAREKAARATRVVTIIDNDQRVNNQTTTCTVNCSNSFFDLGTVILPLNEKIEVAMGHIKTLEQVQIPLHVRDNKTGLASVRMRPRYTISYENV